MNNFSFILNEGYTKIEKQFHQLSKDILEITQIISSLNDKKIDTQKRNDLRDCNISLNKNTVKLKENFKEFYSSLSKCLNDFVRIEIYLV